MCIICVKEKGVKMPTKECFQTMFNRNSDGAGFAYATEDGKTVVKKGFMSFNSFYKAVKSVSKSIDTVNTPMIFHFRIGTAGTNSQGLTHPFVLHSSYNEMKKTELVTDKGVMFHNGILRDFESKDVKLYDVNDTMIFVRTVINQLPHNWYKNKHLKYMLSVLISTSKLAFLIEGKIIMLGKFIDDAETGLKFSNTTYQKYYDYGYFNQDAYWQKWYNDRYAEQKHYNEKAGLTNNSTKNDTQSECEFKEVSNSLVNSDSLFLIESDDSELIDYYMDNDGNYYEYDRLNGKLYKY